MKATIILTRNWSRLIKQVIPRFPTLSLTKMEFDTYEVSGEKGDLVRFVEEIALDDSIEMERILSSMMFHW